MDELLAEEVISGNMTLDEALEECESAEKLLETVKARKAMRQALYSIMYFKKMLIDISGFSRQVDQMNIAMRIQKSIEAGEREYFRRMKSIAYSKDYTEMMKSDFDSLVKVMGGTYYFDKGVLTFPSSKVLDRRYGRYREIIDETIDRASERLTGFVEEHERLKGNAPIVLMAAFADCLDYLAKSLLS